MMKGLKLVWVPRNAHYMSNSMPEMARPTHTLEWDGIGEPDANITLALYSFAVDILVKVSQPTTRRKRHVVIEAR